MIEEFFNEANYCDIDDFGNRVYKYRRIECPLDLLINALEERYPELTFADRAEAELAMLNGFIYGDYEYGPDATAVYINNVRSNGWKDTVSDEIDSFFKSLGVRVGLTARF